MLFYYAVTFVPYAGGRTNSLIMSSFYRLCGRAGIKLLSSIYQAGKTGIMKLVKTMVVVTLALLLNYSLGWTYEKGADNKTPKNDTVVVAASHKYSHITPIGLFFLGKNYRQEWSLPVRMPVFHISSTKGGFTVARLGGGQQTKTLHMVNRDGTKWVLRSVDKEVIDEALPPKVRYGFIKKIVQDQISAAYPYALMTIYDLSHATGVPSSTAELYYVSDDPALGQFRSIFANTVCFLMPKAIEGKDWDTEDTDSIRVKLEQDNRYVVMQERLLKARLLDMLIADWDRHKLQWEWAMIDTLNGHYFFPIPEDRDQAYFLSKGALPFVIRQFGMRHLIGFKEDPKKLHKLNHKAISFDKYFLNRLSRNDWARITKDFQRELSDAVISKATRDLPKEVYDVSGKEIEEKLRSRRNGLLDNVLKYYDYISTEVTITSTQQPEMYQINHYADSSVVTVLRADRKPIYRRAFYPGETKTVNIVNTNKSDRVVTSGQSRIIFNMPRG
jgi:hypothetical protein